MPDNTDFTLPSTWQHEITRSRAVAEPNWAEWEENLRYYRGKSPDAQVATEAGQDYVNVNTDFVNCEVKLSQLFFEQPDLQLTAKGEFKTKPPAAPIPGAPPPQQLDSAPILAAHRALLNELLGPSHADVLPTIHKAIKDCLVTAGVGVTKIGYTATMESLEAPERPGTILGLNQPTQRPVDERWYWDRVPSKKFRIPADFTDTDFDKAPWVAMEFRMPMAQARRLFPKLPDDHTGTTDRDERILTDDPTRHESTSVPYVDGVEIWYRAALFDEDVVNPEVIRRHVLIEGVETFVESSNESPFQTLLPTGRLSADSLRGYPLHVLVIRTVPDSAYVPSDSSMARPLVRELCKFRTQQVQERDANIPRILYDAEQLPPEVVTKIEQGTIGSMIPVPPGALNAGVERVMQQVAQGNQTRGSYIANDYIQRDLDKTLGLDAIGAGVRDAQSSTATEVTVTDRQRSVRLDAERRRVLAWYLKGVEKFSTLVCRYMTPPLAVPYIGQAAAQSWAQWDKKTWEGRFVFNAKPDSQIKLDAATERKFAMDLYQFAARDPHVNRLILLRNLVEKAGLDPTEVLVEQLPDQPEKPNVSFTFKGDDLVAPQAQQVREIAAQGGIQISQEAIDATATQMFQQLSMGIRDANGKAVTATPSPAQHGGPTEKVRPLSQRSADTSGQRDGMAKSPNI